MRGMLAFLLFAGALHVDLEGLLRNKWAVGSLAIIGVIFSTAVIGVLVCGAFALIGRPIPLAPIVRPRRLVRHDTDEPQHQVISRRLTKTPATG
jgi:hypothetical protein